MSNFLRMLLDEFNTIRSSQDEKERQLLRQSTPAPAMGQQQAPQPMDQMSQAPEAALAAPPRVQQTPEYTATRQQFESMPTESETQTAGYEPKAAFDARQGGHYSGDGVESSMVQPLELGAGAAADLARGAVRAAEPAIQRAVVGHYAKNLAKASKISPAEWAASIPEGAHAAGLRRLLASDGQPRELMEEVLGLTPQMRDRLKTFAEAAKHADALKSAVEKRAAEDAPTGVGAGGVRDGLTKIMKLLEDLNKGKK